MNRRQLLTSTGTIILGVSFAGCSGGESGNSNSLTAEEVGRAYLNAYAGGEYSEATSYAAGEKAETITEEEVVEASESETEFEVTDVEQSGRKAKITYVRSAETALGSISETEAMLLVDLSEGWKVVKISSDQDISSKAAELYTDELTGPISVAYDYVKAINSDDDVEQYVSPNFNHPESVNQSVQECIELPVCSATNESDLEQPHPINTRAWNSGSEKLLFESISESNSTTSVKFKYGEGITITLEVIVEQIDGEWKVSSYKPSQT